jgi:hypothetical protein
MERELRGARQALYNLQVMALKPGTPERFSGTWPRIVRGNQCGRPQPRGSVGLGPTSGTANVAVGMGFDPEFPFVEDPKEP